MERRPEPPSPSSSMGRESRARPNAGDSFLGRLLPFPSAGQIASPLEMLAVPLRLAGPLGMAAGGEAAAGPQALASVAVAATSEIVSAAASILDEEMARGVISARRADSRERPSLQSPAETLRPVESFLERIIRLWPDLAPLAAGAGAANARPEDGGVPRLRVASANAGERATTSMILRNRERHAVTLAPACSSLLSTAGDRIEHGAVAFEPCEAALDTDEQREIRIVVTIPAGAKRDRYAGLIVVNGAADLCAVIVLDVT